MKVLHIITDLDTGGAEMMLYKLLVSLQDESVDSSVVSLMGHGVISVRIEELGIKVETLDMGQGERPGWSTLVSLKQLMARIEPDIVQGWMYHGNIAATLAKLLGWMSGCKAGLFWNIRQTLYDLNNEKRQTRWLIHLGRWLSFLPSKIIYNSNMSRKQHADVGYNNNSQVIPNGFDLQQFYPDPRRCQQFRESIGVTNETVLIGHISRFHPMKDHATLLRVVDRVVETSGGHQDIQFLLVGYGVTADLSDHPSIRFLGERTDVAEIMSALDLVVLTSAWGEGFPNVIGEAMASGVPCVVTNVGDSAQIVGQYGLVCSVGDDRCIANSLLRLINSAEQRQFMGQQARKRIQRSYTMDIINEKYLECWGLH